MKTLISSIAILFIFIANLSFSQQYEYDLSEIIAKEKRSFQGQFKITDTTVGKEYDIKYHRLNWSLDPNINYIQGHVYTEFEVTENTSIIEFDLNDNLTVDSVMYHSNSVGFNLANNVLSINLGSVLNIGDIDSVEVFYQGAPASSGFGSWLATNHATGAIISTLSEPYGARDWWPCKQSLDDKIDSIDIFIEVPIDQLAASNGILKNVDTLSTTKVMHWSHRYPITCYLIAISVTNYEQFSDYWVYGNNDSLEILNYCYPQSLSTWQAQSPNTLDILDVFDSLFEVYPFINEKYGHAEWEWGGGMEHQTMSSMANLNFGLVAHELAHQWFGDKVTCGSWEDIWLNEGFATYLTGLTFENGLGTGATLWRDWRTSVINIITSQPDGSVFVDDTTSVNRIFSGRLSYNKGAYLLHMLRWKMGDQNFFTALQNYLQDPNLAFSYAKTADLKNHLELQSGLNLDEFFNDWFYGEGYPTYNLHLQYDQNGDYELTVNQSQSHSSVSFFEMPIEVEFRGLGVDTTIIFNHTSDGQKFTFSWPHKVWAYEFDPELWICAKSNLTLALDEKGIESDIQVYPNPANDQIFIKLGENNLEAVNIQLLDYSGKKMSINFKSDNYEGISISTKDLSSGLYIMNIETKNANISKRIIVE